METAKRRAVLEAIIAGADATAGERLAALRDLRGLDRDDEAARFHRETPEPYVERDPDRIERILSLALEHVGGTLIERKARELIASERRFDLVPDATESGSDSLEVSGPAEDPRAGPEDRRTAQDAIRDQAMLCPVPPGLERWSDEPPKPPSIGDLRCG